MVSKFFICIRIFPDDGDPPKHMGVLIDEFLLNIVLRRCSLVIPISISIMSLRQFLYRILDVPLTFQCHRRDI